jgi:hypothetical protein
MTSVLAQPNLNTPAGVRDRAVLEVFYSTAIRASELASLQVFDLDVARRQMAVNAGKGGRSRVVPIAERAVAWCEKWLIDARPQLAVPPDDGRLFLNNRGGPLSSKTLTAIARKHLDAAGIRRSGSCHLFRHTAATLMLEGGADIRFIQQLLGHAELSTTQLYRRAVSGFDPGGTCSTHEHGFGPGVRNALLCLARCLAPANTSVTTRSASEIGRVILAVAATVLTLARPTFFSQPSLRPTLRAGGRSRRRCGR